MFELKEAPKTKIKIYGKEYELTKPSVKQIKLISSRIESLKSDAGAVTELMLKFISSLGIDAEVLEEMPAEHFHMLIEYIVGTKKN